MNGLYSVKNTDHFIEHWVVVGFGGVEIVVPVGGGYWRDTVWHQVNGLRN